MVETAFVLPILLLIIFAMVYFGMLLYTQIVIQMATGQGARVAAIAYAEDPAGSKRPTPEEKARGFVRAVIASGLSLKSLEGIRVTRETIAGEDAVRVSVAYRFQLAVPLMTDWGASDSSKGLQVIRSSVYRIEVLRP